MIYTDALQTVIMVVGAVILAVKGEVWGLGKGGLSHHPEALYVKPQWLCPTTGLLGW